MQVWIYRRVDGLFLRGGFCDFNFDPSTEDRIVFGDGVYPDLVTTRFDSTSPNNLRPATSAEMDAAKLVLVDLSADISAASKDLLATCATTLERFDPTWAAMTGAQKKSAVQALAVRWASWRKWTERNL